ncbi:hypothetical protein BK133_14925 [Paenibacillus sp. FSL H8-0548]|uniref:YhcN/YlaJ family sporulation lipoprotein n=1 Tax=Paenibacillus sp. FSL H8-0548 TaxID=1920422 RepID=UPI00096E7225|nr:YhcN/YlaJ family sporulation lipoprotein [Paenibacillus sp. FSL H8-0548]OMF32138.1 hypothetical protein BK133_14925 [Paenibacillus sp. FSL H8-0548]
MKKTIKPVLTSVMVLALGFSLAACSQDHTVKQQTRRVENSLNRVETKNVPNGTRMLDNRHYGTNRNYGTDGTYSPNSAYAPNGINNNTMDGRVTGNNSSIGAEQLVDRAEKVSGVKKATVVLHNKDAIVGLDIDNVGKKSIIEKQVYAALKGQYPQYDIHVTSDQGMHQKIRSMNTDMTSGHPIKTLANDINIMIRDIGDALTAPMR